MAVIDLGEPPSLPENTPAVPAIPSGGGRRRFSLVEFLRFVLPRKERQADEGELAAERRERERLMSHRITLEAEAEFYAQLIPDKLERLNICYRYKKSEKDFGEKVKKVSIRKPYILRDEAIYLHVDLRPEAAPRGVTLTQLEDPGTLRDLSIVCGHKVLCKHSPERGFYYIIEREQNVRGIPHHVKYDEVLSGRPATMDGLHLPLGIGEGRRVIWKSLGSMPHMLVAGTTGGGKSNFLNEMICTLLRYNSKKRLRLLLVDLKGGVEFSFYADVPHLLPIPLPAKNPLDPDRVAAIIEDRKDVIPAFDWLVNEGERRLGLLKAGHFKHIGEYNVKHRAEPMTHIVCVVDEWADVKLEPKLGKHAEELLINIASRFRAVGIHLIICTQTPNKNVIDIRVKNVLPARLAFACPNVPSSMLIIGNGRAAGLEPAGRAIYDQGHTQIEIQTPYINNETVDEMVASAIRGQWEQMELAAHDVTEQEIFNWAVEENSAKLQYREVWGHFKHRGLTQTAATKFCKEAEGKMVVVGPTAYTVTPGSRQFPRRLIPVSDEDLEKQRANGALGGDAA